MADEHDSRWLTRWWWHPWVLAVYVPSHLLTQNLRQALPGDFLTILALSLGLAALIWFSLRLFGMSKDRRSLLTTVFLAFFFAYGPYDWLRARFFGAGFAVTPIESRTAAVIFLAAFLYGIGKILRTAAYTLSANRYLNLLTAFLAVVSVLNLGMTWSLGSSTSLGPADAGTVAGLEGASVHPSIYVIILDAYGGEDTLAETYGIDNGPFLKSLSDLGFHVAPTFHANYPYTEFSIATLLNMRYELHQDGKVEEPFELQASGPRMKSASAAVRESVVARELKDLGYEHITFETGFSSVEIPDADVHLGPRRTISDLEGEFINRTALAPLFRLVGMPLRRTFQANDHRRRVQFTSEHLKGFVESERPRFVWAHILLPHQPFVYDATGEPVAPPETFEDIVRRYHEMYREQLEYTNKLVIGTVETLIRKNPGAVVLMLGDHGPRYPGTERKYEWAALARDFSSTLFAVRYPPGIEPERIHAVESHVNVFRALFSDLFASDLPLLPDYSFLPAEQGSSEYVAVIWDGSEPQLLTSSDE